MPLPTTATLRPSIVSNCWPKGTMYQAGLQASRQLGLCLRVRWGSDFSTAHTMRADRSVY